MISRGKFVIIIIFSPFPSFPSGGYGGGFAKAGDKYKAKVDHKDSSDLYEGGRATMGMGYGKYEVSANIPDIHYFFERVDLTVKQITSFVKAVARRIVTSPPQDNSRDNNSEEEEAYKEEIKGIIADEFAKRRGPKRKVNYRASSSSLLR